MRVIDSHTGGEPTRIIVAGGPELGSGSMVERVERFRNDFDDLRTAVVCEPRGSDVWIGGLLCEPTEPESAAGIIFFNTAGYLGMCGHGTIGLMVTLHYLQRIALGDHQLETPVGTIAVRLEAGNRVTLTNVPSYRLLADVEIDVPGVGPVIGDVAWGGNWFFCVKNLAEDLSLGNVPHLTDLTLRIRNQLQAEQVTGTDGAYIDHIELYAAPHQSENHSRNFVLTPGGSYDRSPCGTGTSAKLACLAAEGKWSPGDTWRQESVVGSVFECSFESAGDQVIPTITGQAYISGESTLILDPADPYRTGIIR
ncbi:MAG: proline racemase family protein [Mariniblastus sp.]|nr:proline racemase family protein [Mariniblastus sp.]